MVRFPLVICTLLCLFAALVSAETKETREEKFDDGKVKLKYSVNEDGQKEGAFVEYHPNGKLKAKGTYKKGELEGLLTEFNDKGKALLTATYRAGKLNGGYTELTDKGLKKLSAMYKDGELHGTRTEYEGGVPFFAVSFKNGELEHQRSREDMKKKLVEIDPPDPKFTDEASERDAALRRLKAYRYICEVPYEKLTLDDEMNKVCLAGAQLCAKIGRIEHRPANPGLPEADYKTAFTGTSKSNLAQGLPNLMRAVDGWMDDSDPSNIDRLGHRRWCINPRMAKTGFGRSGKFAAMFSQDQSQKTVPDFDLVAFPARGWMPVEYFNPRYGWNVSFNPQKYKVTGDVEVRVSEIDPKLTKIGEPLKLNYSKPGAGGFGLANCVIFRPEKIERGKRYLVEIDGVKRPDGKTPAPVRYIVEFFSLKS